MKLRTILASIALLAIMSGVAYAAGNFRQVKAGEFDPAHTFLVQAQWLTGVGCPTNAKTFDGTTTGTYTDPACPTGDSGDKRNEGLLLAKTGPTTNFASAGADLRNVRGMALTELGYDLRKPRSTADASGSHCGAGAPRFDIQLEDGTSFFLGCNSPAPTTQTAGVGWLRRRWGGTAPLMAFTPAGVLTNITGKTVKSIEIVFDEGQDTAPDNFGLAVLDNIDVNGQLVGSHGDRSDHQKKDKPHHGGEDRDSDNDNDD